MCEPGAVENVAIEAGIGEAAATDGRLQRTTIALHRKCPCRPNRARSHDAVWDVKEGVDSEGAGRETLGVMLVIYTSTSKSSVHWVLVTGDTNGRDNVLLVFLNPANETATDILHLGSSDFEAKADVD